MRVSFVLMADGRGEGERVKEKNKSERETQVKTEKKRTGTRTLEQNCKVPASSPRCFASKPFSTKLNKTQTIYEPLYHERTWNPLFEREKAAPRLHNKSTEKGLRGKHFTYLPFSPVNLPSTTSTPSPGQQPPTPAPSTTL